MATENTKQYLDLTGLTQYDALIKQEIAEAVAGKADATHTHSEYLTEAQVDAKITPVTESIAKITSGETTVKKAETATTAETATKATQDASGNVITETYETKSDAAAKLEEAKAYADTAVSNHNTDGAAHSDIRNLISELSTKVTNFLDVDDATTDQLSEVLELINNNKGTLDSITSGKINVSDIVDNLTTASADKVLSANQGVELKKLIDALQTAVDGKADTSALTEHTGNADIHFTAEERIKLAGIEEGANKTVVDSALSATSENPVQNKVINETVVSLTGAISANTSGISANTSAISTLQTAVDNISAIPTASIEALFTTTA